MPEQGIVPDIAWGGYHFAVRHSVLTVLVRGARGFADREMITAERVASLRSAEELTRQFQWDNLWADQEVARRAACQSRSKAQVLLAAAIEVSFTDPFKELDKYAAGLTREYLQTAETAGQLALLTCEC